MAELHGTKMVLVSRKDLKLSPGKLAAQVAHAAVACALKAQKNQPDVFRKWWDEGQKKVVVRAETLADLHRLKVDAERAGLTTSLIQDAGHTEVEPGTTTVLGVGPGRADAIDRVTGALQLF